MENTPDPVMQQIISTNGLDQTGKNANGEQSNVSNVDNISDESRANTDNTETPTGVSFSVWRTFASSSLSSVAAITHHLATFQMLLNYYNEIITNSKQRAKNLTKCEIRRWTKSLNVITITRIQSLEALGSIPWIWMRAPA
ncbi:hypothetical protein DdX_19431 [Ditylenchus destructor]|uniref:Uncharacterized protein n=1 Tax=Ditylenchus destructor TaxID=166010 RepID=A0AAD4QSB7_9BILA|nr:hypothetical protein DdX_19431 [Ditylenchus destructor]